MTERRPRRHGLFAPDPPERFQTNGKEVLDRGAHFADTDSEIAAGLTAAALNRYCGDTPHA